MVFKDKILAVYSGICQHLESSGYNCIIYLSAILGIDTSYNEAAMLDGASIWQRIRLITLPMIKPTILMLLILSVGRMFYSDFGLFYQCRRIPEHFIR